MLPKPINRNAKQSFETIDSDHPAINDKVCEGNSTRVVVVTLSGILYSQTNRFGISVNSKSTDFIVESQMECLSLEEKQ
jgi:hypothetical protein